MAQFESAVGSNHDGQCCFSQADGAVRIALGSGHDCRARLCCANVLDPLLVQISSEPVAPRAMRTINGVKYASSALPKSVS